MVINGRDCDRVWTARDRQVARARKEGAAWAKARQTEARAVAFARDNFTWADQRDAFLDGFRAATARIETGVRS